MYDKEEEKLKTCEGNEFKYYYNTSRNNEKYCFNINYDCPDSFPYLNTTSNECINYTEPIPTTIITTIPIIPTTIITTIPKIPTTIITTIPKIPTTIITTTPKIPTTIITTIPKIPTTIITTIPIIPTTIPKIPTTIPKIPTTIITTIPQIKETTIITAIPSTIISNCSYYSVYSQCIFTGLTDEEIFYKLKHDIVSTYPPNGASVSINGSNNFAFELTNTQNEDNNLNIGNSNSIIYLGKCEQTLRSIYNIDNSLPITILKYYNLESNNKANNIELYHPTTHEKLSLSHCEGDTYDVYIPIDLEESVIAEYENAKKQGYDLFNSEDPFYKKVCTQFTSDNGTDVILDDRMSFYYNKVANNTACPQNCKYISYSVETQYLKCECGLNNADISTLDFNHIIGSNTYKSFYSSLKYSNYKVMKCHNLVFNFKIFKHNAGSILILILFIIYIIFMILYFLRDISPLKLSISKLIFKRNSIYNVNEVKLENNNNKNKNNNNNNINNKRNSQKNKNNSINNNKKKESIKNADKTKKKIKYPPKRNKKPSAVIGKSKSNEKLSLIEDSLNTKKEKPKMNNFVKKKSKNDIISDKNNLEIFKYKNKIDKTDEKIKGDDNETEKKLTSKRASFILDKKGKALENKQLEFKDYDNFELNNLDYIPACEIDKRSFCRTYWSVLLREHIALITFVAWHDYNLFCVKVDRFIIQFCTNMAMNGLFFSDESMHNLYVNNGEYDFVQQIPQILYSLIIVHILEVILCFLSLTDTPIYKIKMLSQNKGNAEKILSVINCIKIKLIIFFIFTFLLFLFYWYFISSFCAVYQNTQNIFIRDSMTSFVTSMIDPFLIYLLTNILRVISLSKCCKKKAGLAYNISQLLPIF